MKPADDREDSKFLQIYFMGNSDLESKRRCSVVNDGKSNVDEGIVRELQTLLHQNNDLIKSFKSARDKRPPDAEFRVVLRADKKEAVGGHNIHRGRLNLPTTNEVAILMAGDPTDRRDIVIESRHRPAPEGHCEEDAHRHADGQTDEGEDRSKYLQVISETHRYYDTLQYPIILWNGQSGYSIVIPKTDPKCKQ